MEGRQQPDQHKEMVTRPKEQRSRRGCTRTSVPSDTIGTSTAKRHSKKLEEYTSSEVDYGCEGHSNGGKSLKKKKSPRVQQSKNNPTDDSYKCNHLPIKSSGKQSLQHTSAEEDKGTSAASFDKIAQLTANVRYPVNILHNATEKKPSKRRNKSRSLDLETDNRAEDQSSMNTTIDKQQQLSPAKSKDDDLGENGQQAKVASKKKGKTSKEEESKTSNLDNGIAPETKGRDVKTVNSRNPRRLKDVVDGKLRLKMEDISNAAQKVNKVVDQILKSHQFSKDSLFKDVKKMSTGSYYEHVKISKPNEFDIMLKISTTTYHTIKLTTFDDKGPFYTLAFKNRKPSDMLYYLNEENISSTKIMMEFRKLIKQVIGQLGMKGVSLSKKDPGSPAATLIIKNEPQDISVDLVLALKIVSKWPEQTNHGMNIDDWLGRKVKQEFKKSHFFMVPKQARPGSKQATADTWRISFSNIEKKILTNHGNGKTCCETGGSKREMCCRKQCLKLLKYLLERLKNDGKQKEMDQFCSYHAKTALLHHCAEYPKDEDWKLEDLESCFTRYVNFFQDRLRWCTLYNFFIPSHNLFSAEFVDKSNCEYLCKEIEKHKTNNYSILYD